MTGLQGIQEVNHLTDISHLVSYPEERGQQISLYNIILWRLLISRDYFLAMILYSELSPNCCQLYKVGEIIRPAASKNHKAREFKLSLFRFCKEAAFKYGSYDEYAPYPEKDSSIMAQTVVITSKRRQSVIFDSCDRTMSIEVFKQKLEFLIRLWNIYNDTTDRRRVRGKSTGNLFGEECTRIVEGFILIINGCKLKLSPPWVVEGTGSVQYERPDHELTGGAVNSQRKKPRREYLPTSSPNRNLNPHRSSNRPVLQQGNQFLRNKVIFEKKLKDVTPRWETICYDAAASPNMDLNPHRSPERPVLQPGNQIPGMNAITEKKGRVRDCSEGGVTKPYLSLVDGSTSGGRPSHATRPSSLMGGELRDQEEIDVVREKYIQQKGGESRLQQSAACKNQSMKVNYANRTDNIQQKGGESRLQQAVACENQSMKPNDANPKDKITTEKSDYALSVSLASSIPAGGKTNVVFNLDMPTFFKTMKIMDPGEPFNVIFNVHSQNDISNDVINKIVHVRTVTDPLKNGFFNQALAKSCSAFQCKGHSTLEGEFFSAKTCNVCGINVVLADVCKTKSARWTGFDESYVLCEDCGITKCIFCKKENNTMMKFQKLSHLIIHPDKNGLPIVPIATNANIWLEQTTVVVYSVNSP